jgi:TraM recognition site of TraD and TraG
MKPLFIGKSEDGDPIRLGEGELQTHVHGIGASRTGKSKLIEWIAREMIRNRQGFCLIDPHGFLYDDLVRWLAYRQPKQEIILFEPAAIDRIVGFNPFQRKSEGDLSTLVDRRVQATVKAWGAANSDATPRLEKWLHNLYWAFMEQGYSLDVARYFLLWQEKQIREHLIDSIRSHTVRSQWQAIASLKNLQDFWGHIESTENRLLFRFIEPKQVQRVMGLNINNIDFEDIIENGKILLVNLQPKKNRLSRENARLIGTLLLSELWEIARERQQGPGGRPPSPYFIIIDEFQLFLTPDIPEMLDQAAKYGIHLFLFHQHLSQLRRLDEEAHGSMTNARIKLVFGGLAREDARVMAEEMFPRQIDLKRVKILIEQTKFWPVYGRDKTYSRGSTRASTSGSSQGETWNPLTEEWIPSSTTSDSESSAENEGETNIPIFTPEAFREVSSITPYSLEETLWELSDQLMEQYQRHFMIRIPGKPTRAAITPFVKPWHVRPETVAAYRERMCDRFLRASDVDKALLKVHNDLSIAATGSPLEAPVVEFTQPPPDEEWR